MMVIIRCQGAYHREGTIVTAKPLALLKQIYGRDSRSQSFQAFDIYSKVGKLPCGARYE